MGQWGMGSGKGEHRGYTGNEGGPCTRGEQQEQNWEAKDPGTFKEP